MRKKCIHGKANSGYLCKKCKGTGLCEHLFPKSNCRLCGTWKPRKKKSAKRKKCTTQDAKNASPKKRQKPILTPLIQNGFLCSTTPLFDSSRLDNGLSLHCPPSPFFASSSPSSIGVSTFRITCHTTSAAKYNINIIFFP